MKVLIKTIDKFSNKDLQLLRNLVLLGKINLIDIPFKTRVKNKSLYIYSLRYARTFKNSARYINSLKILYRDILKLKKMNNVLYIEPLSRLFVNYIELNPYRGDRRIEHIKKLLEKKKYRIKKKPIIKEYTIENIKNYFIYCPRCNHLLTITLNRNSIDNIIKENHFCPHCGQNVNFSKFSGIEDNLPF